MKYNQFSMFVFHIQKSFVKSYKITRFALPSQILTNFHKFKNTISMIIFRDSYKRKVFVFLTLIQDNRHKTLLLNPSIFWNISWSVPRFEPALSKAWENFGRRRYMCLAHTWKQIIALMGYGKFSVCSSKEELCLSCHKQDNWNSHILIIWCPAYLFIAHFLCIHICIISLLSLECDFVFELK